MLGFSNLFFFCPKQPPAVASVPDCPTVFRLPKPAGNLVLRGAQRPVAGGVAPGASCGTGQSLPGHCIDRMSPPPTPESPPSACAPRPKERVPF